MNCVGRTAATLFLMSGLGCTSSGAPECRGEIQSLQDEVRDLKRRLDDLDGTSLGASLLSKFPPSQWSQERRSAILRREVVEGKFPSAEEGEFIENFDAWKKALERSRESGAK